MDSLVLRALLALAASCCCASGTALEGSLLERSRRQADAPLTTAQQTAIVALHNQLRAKQGASNMQILSWNATLATQAQSWSAGCVLTHGPLNGFGQNIASSLDTSVSQAFTDSINMWYAESAIYSLGSNTCTSSKGPLGCMHYTQLVWATTTQVGCGITNCPSPIGAFIVCNYAPCGNFVPTGQSKPSPPFLAGTACTQCTSGVFYCNGGLCDSTCSAPGPTCQCAAACKRCSTQTSGCTCQCQPGTMGLDCSANCADLSTSCNPPIGVSGWGPGSCKSTNPTWAFVPSTCPLMCGLCQAGTSTC